VVGVERYAVVSCHVERMLDDAVYTAYLRVLERRPGGFAIASLARPPDAGSGEDEERWLERARALAALGPLGHHTHWTSASHARPTDGATGERVRREGAWLERHGVRATLFCGGGWYTDASVAAAVAELGYADCTPRASRPAYLDATAAWAELREPARLTLEGGAELLALPTTRTAGEALRATLARHGPSEPLVHSYFHDTDLVDRRRRAVVLAGLALLGRRRRATDLDSVAATLASAPPVAWQDVARGGAGTRPA
jgi:hypothetical protein